MKIGIDQFRRPTPNRINILFDFFVGFCGIVAGFCTGSTFISHKLGDIISSILSTLLIPILLLAKRCFGSEVTAHKVPIEYVAVIHEENKKTP